MDKSKEAKYAITRNKTNIYKTDKTDIYKIAWISPSATKLRIPSLTLKNGG